MAKKFFVDKARTLVFVCIYILLEQNLSEIAASGLLTLECETINLIVGKIYTKLKIWIKI